MEGLNYNKFLEYLKKINFEIKKEKNLKDLYNHLKFNYPKIWQALNNNEENALNILKIINIFFQDSFFTELYIKEKIKKERRIKFIEEIEMNKIERYLLNRLKNFYKTKILMGVEGELPTKQLENEVCKYYNIQPTTFRAHYRPKIKKLKKMAKEEVINSLEWSKLNEEENV